jgi:glycosyltransferase involved in cell wall biosynthesis
MFFPRGGSSHVARALARELPAHGCDVTVVSGSTAGAGDARAFYAGLDPVVVDFDAGDAPMHPSYEDRPGAVDKVFAAVGPDEYADHVEAWAAALDDAGAAEHDVLHLHHLTPMNEVAALVAPDVPVVGHLHGTELLMLEEIANRPEAWPYAREWTSRLRRWAGQCERLLLLSPAQVPRAVELLGVSRDRLVVSPNGFDPVGFDSCAVDRAAHWRAHLAHHPRGWRPGEGEGSVAYDPEQAAAVADGVVLLFAGRFTAVKRVELLVRAFASARSRFAEPASLVLVGGHPGEWEGTHPWDAVQATGARDVYLAGWQAHDVLPSFFSASDALVLPSVREQFGSVIVEAMACGLPAIAVNRMGPAEIVDDGRTGWLVEPDDEAQLADAMVACVADAGERRRRGDAARRIARERYAWPAIAGRVGHLFGNVAEAGGARLAGSS